MPQLAGGGLVVPDLALVGAGREHRADLLRVEPCFAGQPDQRGMVGDGGALRHVRAQDPLALTASCAPRS